ncbi:hypothetical protein NQ317_000903 [Molorchus minor]|uniref:Uncharacterized protein n=1 Tax=Molorchus minor TaxID=1323400 RepID=A0ABQ9JK00_9CUCU|nr:hypothetical protein NQ317_000903 [Molorchus minor]
MSLKPQPKFVTPEETENITKKVAELISINKSKADSEEIIRVLTPIKAECEKSLRHKVVLGKAGAYPAILDTLTISLVDRKVIKLCFRTLICLMRKQPDLLDARGIRMIISFLRPDVDSDLTKLALKWTKECCILHEMNRQKIFNANIVVHLKQIFLERTIDVVKEALSVSRALILDDDVRVQYGKAHEHARAIAMETLCALTSLLRRHYLEEYLVTDLLRTLSALLVRDEFCKKVEDAGCLDVMVNVIQHFVANDQVMRHSFKLLKTISGKICWKILHCTGNDDCKIHIIEKNYAPLITTALDANKAAASAAIAGLHCVAALSLRCPQNSKALIDAGLPEVIVAIMKMHPDEETVQKTASWAIRNMVSRNKTHGRMFINLGVEELLHANLNKFENIDYDTKAALRDLNCNVNLKEEWTGRGGALTTGFTFTNIELS